SIFFLHVRFSCAQFIFLPNILPTTDEFSTPSNILLPRFTVAHIRFLFCPRSDELLPIVCLPLTVCLPRRFNVGQLFRLRPRFNVRPIFCQQPVHVGLLSSEQLNSPWHVRDDFMPSWKWLHFAWMVRSALGVNGKRGDHQLRLEWIQVNDPKVVPSNLGRVV
uniref:Uncharacterized protein n=1 Tax=Cucumis melo TaxID=3656 RepID=A0A9I9E2L5_CUCME